MPVSRKSQKDYSVWFSSGLNAKTSALAGQSALVSRVERDLFQVMPNPQPRTRPASAGVLTARTVAGGARVSWHEVLAVSPFRDHQHSAEDHRAYGSLAG